MKISNFLWSYNGAALRADTSQTRSNFAKLLRSWRMLPGYTVFRAVSSRGVSYTVTVGGLSATQLVAKIKALS